MAEIDLGKIQPLWRGEFTGSPTNNYEPLDNVGYLDTVYICIQEADGSQLPTDTAYFKPLIDLTTYKLQSVIAFVVSQYADGDAATVAPISAGLPLLAYDWFVDQNTLQVFSKNGATGAFSDPLDFDPSTGTDSGVTGSIKNIDGKTSMSLSNFAWLVDEKPSGTFGGSSVVGSQNRTLNTEKYNSISSVCDITTNGFTLAAGDYFIDVSVPAFSCVETYARLIDFDTGDTLLRSTGREAVAVSKGVTVIFSGHVMLTSETEISIAQYINTAQPTSGLGLPTNISGLNEIYTNVKIWKLS